MLNKSNLNELCTNSEFSAVAAAIKVNGLHLFSAPFNWLNANSEYIPFHSIGGRCFKDEHWSMALKREVAEELEEDILLISAVNTRLYTSAGDCKVINLSDSPKPFCVIKKTMSTDINFYHLDVNWLIAYKAELKVESLHPHQEVAILLLLTDDMLIQCMKNKISYNEIAQSKDGSQLIIRDEATFDDQKLALPSGLAFILAKELIHDKKI